MRWSGFQTSLEDAESDVLILLDCCAAARSISGSGSGVTEVLAACGPETWSPGVGEHAFTRNLIDELQYCGGDHNLSVASFHQKVLARIKSWKPTYSNNGESERRRTPIHTIVSSKEKQRSIDLVPSLIEAPSIVDEKPSDTNQSSIDQVRPDDNPRSPKVLLSLSLEQVPLPNTIEWVQSVPALTKYANVHGIYKSGSTLMILSIPVAIWDLLPKDPAVAFIGFTDSENLLGGNPLPIRESADF